MSTADEGIDLDSAIAGVYGGPLEEFIRRRDALAKELRSAGRKDDASAVKGLRKPSRMAWALDTAVLGTDGAVDALDSAVEATIQAHASGGDVPGAIASLRAAVREFAGHAASGAGHRLEEAALANAVLAVIGKTDAFNALRRGRLADVPDAGGLDFLSSLPTPEQIPQPARRKPPEAAPEPSRSRQREDRLSAARQVARQAAAALADARERSEAARRALSETESKLRAAEEQLRQIETEVRALRIERDRVRRESETAAAQVLDAKKAAALAESKLDRPTGP